MSIEAEKSDNDIEQKARTITRLCSLRSMETVGGTFSSESNNQAGWAEAELGPKSELPAVEVRLSSAVDRERMFITRIRIR